MNTATAALLCGVVVAVAGLLGFAPAPPPPDAPPLAIEHGHTHTTFGLVPIWGHDVSLHGAIAVVSAYFGFVRGNIDVTHHTPAHTRA